MDEIEFSKLLNQAVKPIIDRLEALEKQTNAAPTPITEDPEFKKLAEVVKTLNAAFPDIQSFKATQEIAKTTAQKTAFAKLLNAAHQPTGKPDDEFEKAWNAASADPLGRDVWLANHPEVKVKLAEEKPFVGKILNASGAETTLEAEQARIWGYQ